MTCLNKSWETYSHSEMFYDMPLLILPIHFIEKTREVNQFYHILNLERH